mmetsp:Transcript_11636/g.52598  ORF Transcript_11636/g.52598 Transcript_11636/m.52598 type:complete len:347 (-) Transcript_11636:1587-2627(-)
MNENGFTGEGGRSCFSRRRAAGTAGTAGTATVRRLSSQWSSRRRSRRLRTASTRRGGDPSLVVLWFVLLSTRNPLRDFVVKKGVTRRGKQPSRRLQTADRSAARTRRSGKPSVTLNPHAPRGGWTYSPTIFSETLARNAVASSSPPSGFSSCQSMSRSVSTFITGPFAPVSFITLPPSRMGRMFQTPSRFIAATASSTSRTLTESFLAETRTFAASASSLRTPSLVLSPSPRDVALNACSGEPLLSARGSADGGPFASSTAHGWSSSPSPSMTTPGISRTAPMMSARRQYSLPRLSSLPARSLVNLGSSAPSLPMSDHRMSAASSSTSETASASLTRHFRASFTTV